MKTTQNIVVGKMLHKLYFKNRNKSLSVELGKEN